MPRADYNFWADNERWHTQRGRDSGSNIRLACARITYIQSALVLLKH